MNIDADDLQVAFSGQLSQAEFSRVQALMMPPWTRWYVAIPCAICLFISTGVGWPRVWAHPSTAAPDLLLAAAVLVAVAAITSYGRRKRWRQVTAITGSVHGVLTAAGIEWNTDNSSSRFSWEKLVKIRRTRDLTLVFYAPACAFYFPRSFFHTSDSWRTFNESVTARIRA